MKLSYHSASLLVFLFFLVPSSTLFARPLATTEQGQNMKLQKVSREDFVLEMEGAKSLKGLGMEKCNSGDEECLVKRMSLEVHIDYIYTEHHKP